MTDPSTVSGLSVLIELALRFLTVGALAFGGGQTALPLVERLTVGQMHWLTPRDFAAGVGFAYLTPGPVLILATYAGYRVAGIPGGLVATAAVYAIPVILALAAAGLVARLREALWFRAFGSFAGAAAIGLLGVTLVSVARPLIAVHPLLLVAAGLAVVAERRGLSPTWVLLLAAGGGALLGASDVGVRIN